MRRSSGAPRWGITARLCGAAGRPRSTPNCIRIGSRRRGCPLFYLHGTDDGCSEDYTPCIDRVLPDESEIALVESGGHFLQLDQPNDVGRHIVDFVGTGT